MASIAPYREMLKQEVDARQPGLLSPESRQIIESRCQGWDPHSRNRFWTPLRTLWTFLGQVLHVGSSCRAAVAIALAQEAAGGKTSLPSSDPSAYCQARQRLPLGLLQDLLRQIGQRLRDKVAQTLTWCGRRVWLVDGTSCSMPDTPHLQAAFGQPDGQAPGCGFPVAKVVALFCWASGAVL